MPALRLSPTSLLLPCLFLLLLWARPTHAFGAGNIASTAAIEGQNWRHGDIEDTLLNLLCTSLHGGKKFKKMDVRRVYFGNWLRDYSQAVDVGALKMVSAEAVRLLLWILGFMTFGYGTGEFEVTKERLGCYRPEEHIDNPKDYADNLDAREYDERLRGPVDEEVELAVDERTGMKNYIANERAGIETSAGLVRRLFGRSIELYRRYNRSGDKKDRYEALRLLGTGCHCLEDFPAHSNFTELALIELGERDVFPHVGRRTKQEIEGVEHPVYPLITGTFGGVDFLHSVMGEFTDKAAQSEVSELEGAISDAQKNREASSKIKELLDKLPSGILGGGESGKADELEQNATAAQMENMDINPKDPEAFVVQMEQLSSQIMPILEFHDGIMKSISIYIDKLPVIPDMIEEFQDNLNIFVFSLIAPFILPVIQQVSAELKTGSSEVIQSSVDQQHVVFNDDHSSNPTHSMLSKDHFSNILNEPAGKVASQVLKWVVPQIVECWDNEDIDADRTIQRIIAGVFHHPAKREYGDDGASKGRQLMFEVVRKWWEDHSEREQDDLREKLSRDGVENGLNHREGVHDSGHGCGKPIAMPKMGSSSGGGAQSGGVSQGGEPFDRVSQLAGEAVGGGALGGLVGGFVNNVGSSLLGGAFGGNTERQESSGYGDDGSYNRSYSEQGRSGDNYGQAEYSRSEYPGGRGHREEYSRQESSGGGNYGESRYESSYQSYESSESRSYGGERREEYGSGGGGYGGGERREYGSGLGYTGGGGDSGYGGGYGGERREEYGGGYGGGERREEYGGGERRMPGGFGDDEEYERPRRHHGEGGGYGGGYGGGGYGGGY